MTPHHILAALLLMLFTTSSQAAPLPVEWADELHVSGANGPVNCLARWQGDVVIAGQFDAIGPIGAANHVARLRDGVWEPLGEYRPMSNILAMTEHDGFLHALTQTSSVFQVVRLEDNQWVNVGPPCPNARTMASFQGDLHVGSSRLEDGAWVNRLQTDDQILSLVVTDSMLIAGGSFSSAAGLACGHVVGWDGQNVINVFPGQTGLVADLAFWNGRLYAAMTGQYPEVHAVQVWQDGTWNGIPELGMSSVTKPLTSLAADGDRLLLCGYWFPFILKSGSAPPDNRSLYGTFARSWDGTTATNLFQVERRNKFLAIMADDEGVLVAGEFTSAGQPPCSYLGRIVDGELTPVCNPGYGPNDIVIQLQSAGENLIVGGAFSTIGGHFSRSVAVRANASEETWSARDLGNGEEIGDYQELTAVWQHNNYLYATGWGPNGKGIGYYENGLWNMIPQSFNFPEFVELLTWNGMLLGNGEFSTVYRFSSLAAPTVLAQVDGPLWDIHVHEGDLLLGGSFENVEGVPAYHVAIFTDGSWQQLGEGLPGAVRELGSWRGSPVASTSEDGNSQIYVFENGQWSLLGEIANGYVRGLAEMDGLLFAGGHFYGVADDGSPMNGLACWDGSHWRSVGRATGVKAMAVHDSKLWLGGTFHFGGGLPAAHLTYLTLADISPVQETIPSPTLSLLGPPSPNPFNPRTTLNFELPAAAKTKVVVFDARGRQVAELLHQELPAGAHEVVWDGRDNTGRDMPSGIYLVRLEAGSLEATTKMTLTR